jgi:cytochrome c oxidase assembly protein subunit 15
MRRAIMSIRQAEIPEDRASRWPHRLAWVLACAVLPLLVMGELVTTYDAGMAVPDWPTSRGHWFYPIQHWLWTFNDFFLEHGHRTIAQLVGLLAIALAVSLWLKDRRRWMRWLAAALVAGVVFQGTLGGLRVWWDDRVLAQIHGLTAPLFFGLCVGLVALTSRRWAAAEAQRHAGARRLRPLGVALTAGFYVEIFLGTQLRHPAWEGWFRWFELWVWLKIIVAAALAAGIVWLLVDLRRNFRDQAVLRRRGRLLALLFVVQLVLAATTWVSNYGFPAWYRNYISPVEYTVVRNGLLQVTATTAHAAAGALCLVTAFTLTLWSFRLLRVAQR